MFHHSLLLVRCPVVVQSLFSQSLNNDWTTTGQRPNNRTVGLLVSVVNQCIVETRNWELEIRGWYLRIFFV